MNANGLAPEEDIRNRKWYAVHTAHQHEASVSRHLLLREVEAFLPIYERTRVWKNRQRVTSSAPLFPGYLFVSIAERERGSVLATPGVLRLVGNSKGPIPIPDPVIDVLRSSRSLLFEPYAELPIGQRVRVKHGPMRDITGVLVRKNKSMRFVLSIEMINQHAAVEVDADDLELLPDQE
jgi:transcription antitermination factor NusG